MPFACFSEDSPVSLTRFTGTGALPPNEKMPPMPIYEYACTACGERTEKKQSFDDAPLEECPSCGGKLRKLYSPVGIVFKGSGFYSTDAKPAGSGSKTDSKAKEGASTAKEGGASTPSKSSEPKAKQDSKPAAASSASDS